MATIMVGDSSTTADHSDEQASQPPLRCSHQEMETPNSPSAMSVAAEETPTSERLASNPLTTRPPVIEPWVPKTFSRPESRGIENAQAGVFSFAPAHGKVIIPQSSASRIEIYPSFMSKSPTASENGHERALPPQDFETASSEVIPVAQSTPRTAAKNNDSAAQLVLSDLDTLPLTTVEPQQIVPSTSDEWDIIGDEQQNPRDDTLAGLELKKFTSASQHGVGEIALDGKQSTTSTVDDCVPVDLDVVINVSDVNMGDPDFHHGVRLRGPEDEQQNANRSPVPTKKRPSAVLLSASGHLRPKVTKSTARNALPNPSGPRTRDFLMGSSQECPSEEELLYVLVQRTQNLKESESRSQAEQEILRKENVQLRKDKDQCSSDLQNALASQAEAHGRYQIIASKLEAFKIRYYKIKIWAREMNNDYIGLRERGDTFKDVVHKLKQEKEVIKSDVKAIHATSFAAMETIQRHGKEMPQLRTLAEKLLSNFRDANAVRMDDQVRLLEEKRRNRKFETHISNLTNTQQKYDNAAKAQNEAISQNLHQPLHKVDSVANCLQADPKPPEVLDQCINLLQAINTKNEATLSSLDPIHHAIEGLADNLAKNTTSIEECLKQVDIVASQRQESCKALELQQAIAKLGPDLAEFQKLKQDQARLENKIAGDQNLIELLRKANIMSENHAAAFQKGNESLTDFLKFANQIKDRQKTDLEDANRQLQLKWTTACSDLAESKEIIQQSNERIQRLSRSLEELQGILNDAQAKRAAVEENCNRKEKEHQAQLAKQSEDTKAKFDEMRKQITMLSVEIERETQKETTMSQKIEHFKSLHGECLKSLKTAHSELQYFKKENDQIRLHHEEVENKLEKANFELMKVPDFQERLEALKAEVDRLNETQTDFERLRDDLASLESQGATKDLELTSLRAKLEEAARLDSKKVEELTQELRTYSEQREGLEEQLVSYEAKVTASVTLSEQLQHETFTRLKLDADLTSAKKVENQLQSVSKENQVLSQKIAEIEQKLRTAQKLNEANRTLEDLNQQKDAEIARLREQVTAMDALPADLDAKNDEISLKDAELEIRQTRILKLESELQKLNQPDMPRPECPRDESMFQNIHNTLGEIVEQGNQNASESRDGNWAAADDSALATPQQRLAVQSGRNRSVVQFSLREDALRDEGSITTSPTAAYFGQSNIQETWPVIGDSVLTCSQTQSTESTTFIPDSQLAPLQGMLSGSFRLPRTTPQEESNSSPSELSNAYDLSNDDGVTKKPKNLAAFTVSAETGEVSENQTYRGLQKHSNNGRPSSSALSDDLFKQYATGLEAGHSSQVRSIRKKGRNEDNSPRSFTASAHPHHRIQRPESRKSLVVTLTYPPEKISPRHLRNGTQIGVQRATPFPESRPSPTLEDTSILNRDRYQSNSAAKRTVDNDQVTNGVQSSGKRLKWNSANLETGPPPRKLSGQSPASGKKNSGGIPFRKGSVIAMNAPALCRSQRGQKSVRKNSKEDKYEMRFCLGA